MKYLNGRSSTVVPTMLVSETAAVVVVDCGDHNNLEDPEKKFPRDEGEGSQVKFEDLLTRDEVNAERLQHKRHILPWKQRFNWDCGIACVAMCLPLQSRFDLYQRLDYYKAFFGFNNSTWTIDLCYILKHYNVPHRFITRFAGVDPSLKNISFYKDSLDKDTSRVLLGFAQAEGEGIDVRVDKMFCDEICEHIYSQGPAIVLVNSTLLTCLDCSPPFQSLITCCFRRCYQGHYVVAIGYDLKKRWIYYNNPTYGDRTCKMFIEDFEAARTAPGTDWDVILVTVP